jgi:FkbM family methyltransferase
MSQNLDSFYKPKPDCQIPQLDKIYTKFFGEINNGTFLEIGAYDGVTHSNTCFLAEIGWKGVYVEPVLEYWKTLAERYRKMKNVYCIRCAVSDYNDKGTMFVAGEMSTLDPEYISAMNSTGYFNNVVHNETQTVTVTTLTDIVKGASIETLDLLVIDAEGSELQIINGYDWKIKPRMIIIELHEKSEGWMRDQKQRHSAHTVTEHLKATLGYTQIYADDINSIFTLNDK